MQREGYDSWEGFVSAGFAAEDDGGIHLAGTKGWCSVWREDGRLRVQFGIDMPDVLEHRSEFDFPAVAGTLQHWAALFARRSLGDRRKLDLIERADDEDVPHDLVELLQYGFDHEDSLPEAPPTEEVRRMPEHATEGADVEFFTAMRRTLEDAREGLWSRIDDSSERHDVGAAKESLAKLEKIDALVARVDDLEREWKAKSARDSKSARWCLFLRNFDRILPGSDGAFTHGKDRRRKS